MRHETPSPWVCYWQSTDRQYRPHTRWRGNHTADWSRKTGQPLITLSWGCALTKSNFMHTCCEQVLKVSYFRNGFWGHWFPPKNERTNSTLMLWYLRSTCFCSFFGGNRRSPKNNFEINWPLKGANKELWGFDATLFVELGLQKST